MFMRVFLLQKMRFGVYLVFIFKKNKRTGANSPILSSFMVKSIKGARVLDFY